MKRKPPLTPRQRVSILNAAIEHTESMHGSVTGEDHLSDVQKCPCEYGLTIRGLKSMRREAYAAVQKGKTHTCQSCFGAGASKLGRLCAKCNGSGKVVVK